MSKAVLFSKVGCTPCVHVKKFILTETDIEYTEYDVEKDVEKAEEYGIMSVPTFIVGDERVTGFNPAKIMELANKVE